MNAKGPKVYTFDEICDSRDFNHEEEFILWVDHESALAESAERVNELESGQLRIFDLHNKVVDGFIKELKAREAELTQANLVIESINKKLPIYTESVIKALTSDGVKDA